MKGWEKDGMGPSDCDYGPQTQSRYASQFCDKCWNPAFIHVDETAVCETHARAFGVIA